MFFGDARKRGIREQPVPALGKRSPRFDLHAPFAHQFLAGNLLAKRVGLNLVYGGRDIVVGDQIGESVGLEVADAYRANFTLRAKLLHSAPRPVDVPERLVYEIQVQIVEPEAVERLSERRFWRSPCRPLPRSHRRPPCLSSDSLFRARRKPRPSTFSHPLSGRPRTPKRAFRPRC